MRRPLNTPWKFGKNHMPLADHASVNVRHGQVGLVRLLLTTMQALKRWGVLSSAAGSFDRPSVPMYLAFMFFVIDLCSLFLSGVVRMLADWWPFDHWRESLAVSRFDGLLATITSQLERSDGLRIELNKCVLS